MRYFAYTKAGRMQSHTLLSDQQIQAVLSVLDPATTEAFASMQTYDDQGNIVSCPVYADLDGETALEDTRYLVYLMQECLDVIPRVWFSGNKGFHLIIPYEITHPQAHVVVKNFVLDISRSIKSLDNRVYRTKSLWRLSNWKASVDGRYKVEITYSELMNMDYPDIIALSFERRTILVDSDVTRLSECKMFQDHLARSINKIPEFTNSLVDFIGDMDSDLMPCLENLISNMPLEGQRNQGACILARFFKHCAVPIDQALSVMLSYSHWAEFNLKGEVDRVFKSIYSTSTTPRIGCRGNSSDAVMLRDRCDPLCPLNEDFLNVGFKR